MKKLLLITCITLIISCSDEPATNEYTPLTDLTERELAGGETTIFSSTSFAFENPAANLTGLNLDLHLAGDAEFENTFVTAGSPINPGLGPRFNNTNCVACHPRDGRAAFPTNVNAVSGLLYRISLGNDPATGPIAVPNYGTQAQNQSVIGFVPEMDYKVTWQEHNEVLADGTVVTLRKPTFSYENPYMPIPSGIKISARIAPPVFGLGLLEAIPENDILALADENDVDGDGISGKANYVINPETGAKELGRFGWKANTSNLRIQSAAAYHEDMGITNEIFSKDIPKDGFADDPEITPEVLNQVTVYCQTLAVPAARNITDEKVQRGATIFNQINCASCHTPKQQTQTASISALANQTIWPYTDMLLHDMGDGLADNRGDFLANGKEWKTRPLWGIGLTQVVNGHTNFLHDGRARNITEAILWHDGEAKQSKEAFKQLTKKDRDELLAFINSL
ncbi:c-type cytochrome [Tenacibaculum aiptasiae]|uniref:C-type cytochrome n=1 Tax=Tenacibaculum aiptasiae TaxID=426481 RepID=A0A7J5ANM2_9FLAO|nr:di-heme oxidoredictase family protein [Tenacibaculum aiptasiae]KAB1158569.1 c-type cytochrome [Tenacibaculum aiptasiae]